MNERNNALTGEFARALCSASDYHSLVSTVVRETRRSLDAENMLVWIYDDHRGVLV